MKRLTEDRIDAVVAAHRLDKRQAEAVTSAASHIVEMFTEWKLSREAVAATLEMLSHWRLDRCPLPHQHPFDAFTDAVAEMGRRGLSKDDLMPTLLDFTAATAIALGGDEHAEEGLTACVIRLNKRIIDFKEGTFPEADEKA